MPVKTASDSREAHFEQPDQRRESTNLDRRYGAIGIVAVAAAARYAGNGNKPARASAQIDQRFIELAT
jgi:hypothetical protein